MQASALSFAASLPAKIVGSASAHRKLPPGVASRRRSARLPPLSASAQENLTVDYSSSTSVFPAEACETLGGDACAANVFPETKLPPANNSANANKPSSEQIDREYLDYSEPRTVFPDEACDDLGGDFCKPEYQKA
ncbi:CCR-like protein [Wolffia australiana]|uniref:Light-regulated protein n=1 Tax=Wolffia australiana TaxID=161112 RepID=H6U803_WOLAU|nr:light-regulated protein precursor [Wolffia australiana]AEZ52391.1 light-regulated protein precursor [Wolffia australiana]